jgi:hypothetical protein
MADEVIARLIKSGWPADTANVVGKFHSPWLAALRPVDPEGCEGILIRLEQHSVTRVADVLSRKPELTGLFLLVDDASSLAIELDDPADGDLIASLFQLHADAEDAKRLAAALPGNRELIAQLLRRGFVGAEHLFVFARGTPAGDEYSGWLYNLLRAGLHKNDDALADVIFMLFDHGPEIRRRMSRDDGFRRQWTHLWSKLAAIVGGHGNEFAPYLGLPGLWDFLALPQAELLLERKGALAVDLLLGQSTYPRDVQETLIQLLLDGKDRLAEFLWIARREPALLPFLRRNPPLGLDLWTALAADVLKHRTTMRPRLELHQLRLADSEAKLRESLDLKSPGPKEWIPFYSVYKIFDDIADGEVPSTLDVVFAAVDLADVAVPGGKLVTTLGKSGARKLGKDQAKHLLRTEAKKVATNHVKDPAGLAGRNVLANRAAADLVASQAYRRHVNQFSDLLKLGPIKPSHSGVEFEMTALVQHGFQTFGFSRQTVRRLTGLEARVFMRRDATVIVRLSPSATHELNAAGRALAEFIRERVSPAEVARPEALDANSEAWKTVAAALWFASAADLLPTTVDAAPDPIIAK